ncbi:MAG TPA: HD domain-containing phosphohydrolase [Solirubrobacterales bacterium]|nr:HD domain-containing phosphohydrolase [Solirubrobacterales bacterium]
MRAVQRIEAVGWRIWDAIVGPSGWRSVIGPLVFAVLGIGLLIYNHLNQRVTDIVFWLTLGLIVTVFVRMLETNRRQSQALEEQAHEAFNDRVTALPNRRQLEADIEAMTARPGERRMLVLLELEGLQTYGDRLGYAAGDELLRHSAQNLVEATGPLGGIAYRFGTARLAALVPYDEQRRGGVILAVTDSLRDQEADPAINRSYGEVAIPDEAADAEVAFQLAGQRLEAHRQRQQRSARRQAHAVLMAALSARRPELRDHLRMVAYRAISLARHLGMGTAEIDDVALAAELQDVGLLAVPESVLEKETSLSQAETAMVHSHTAEGERIIAAAPALASVAGLVRSSAERYDGSGYPDGLAGEAIPLGARIIAVAVAFAALTVQRPYRPALNPSETLAELRRCSGTQFDPRVVEALSQDLAEEAAPVGPDAAVSAPA